MDLSPRTEAPAGPTPRPASRRWLPLVVLALVLVAGGVLVTQFLRSAVDYYCNVDEIDQRAGCEAGRRLRVQGTVDAGTLEVLETGATSFTMTFNGVTMPVRLGKEPGGMFRECQPVVVHGELEAGTFRGSHVEVKHSNEYEAENADRLDAGAAASESRACGP